MKSSQTSVCPLCRQTNDCTVNRPQDCWCMEKDVPAALIKKAQALQQEPSCICQACINRYLSDHPQS